MKVLTKENYNKTYLNGFRWKLDLFLTFLNYNGKNAQIFF